MKPHCILISLFLKRNILFKLLLLTFVLDIKIFNIFYFRLTMRGSHGLPLFIPIEMFYWHNKHNKNMKSNQTRYANPTEKNSRAAVVIAYVTNFVCSNSSFNF